jgi:hypothetical protein
MTRLSASDGIRWHPRSVIDKYSSDQVSWARSRDVPVTGSALRSVFRFPEDGSVRDEGNGVSVAGVLNLALILTGTGGHPLAPGQAVFGVGSDPGAFDREQVNLSKPLGEEAGRSWYRPMDPGYPWVPRPGVIEGQATFLESEACFAWHEWCWGTGPGKPVPHHSLRGCYAGEQPVMMNRKAHAAGYGFKDPGVAWVFRTEITLS